MSSIRGFLLSSIIIGILLLWQDISAVARAGTDGGRPVISLCIRMFNLPVVIKLFPIDIDSLFTYNASIVCDLNL